MSPSFDPTAEDPLVDPPDGDPDFAEVELPPLRPTDVSELAVLDLHPKKED